MTLSFSIITVCYNNGATIADTLRSVAAQTWPHYEHIVVDGASRDNTAEVVASLAGPNTQFVSEPDRGIYDAMNKGCAHAKGDVICFLNADDYYAGPDILEKVARLLEAEQLDAVLGEVSFFSPDTPEKVVRRYDSGQFSPARLAYGWMPAHPGMFVRRAIYERVGPFRTDYRIAGDFEWIARAFGDGKISYRHLPEVMVRMRTGGTSTKGIGATILINREILRACAENGIETNALRLSLKFPRKLLELLRR